MRVAAILLFVLILIVVVVTYRQAHYEIDETQQVVVTRFGRPIRTVTEPGKYRKAPFSEKLQYLEKGPLELRNGECEVITRDRVALRGVTSARWRVTDPPRFLERLANRRHAERRIAEILEGELRAEIGKLSHAEIENPGTAEFHTAETALTVLEHARARTGKHGIEILEFDIEKLEPLPEAER